MAGRASPADCADEDVHNPSADGVRYVSDSFLLAKSGDFASYARVATADRADGIRYVSGAWECAKIRYFRSYAGVATDRWADGVRYVSGAGVVFLLFF